MVLDKDNNNINKGKKIKKRSIFSESDELEKRLAAARKKADADRANCLTAENARDELAYMLLKKSLREMFARVDREQGGNFVLGSMEHLSSKMWKGVK